MYSVFCIIHVILLYVFLYSAFEMTIGKMILHEKETQDSLVTEQVLVNMADFVLQMGVAEYQAIPQIEHPKVKSSSPASGKITESAPQLVVRKAFKEESIALVVKAIGNALLQLEKRQKLDSNLLKKNKEFTGMREDDVVLLHRFVTKRDEFLKTYNFLDAKRFAAILGLKDINTPRKMKNMREQGLLIFVKTGDAYLYPEFQLNSQGMIFEDLRALLPDFTKAGRSGWDICFWLFNKQSLLLQRSSVDAGKLKGLSFDEMMTTGKKAKAQSQYVKGMPIDALRYGNKTQFFAMAKEWISPDSRLVDSEVTSLG
jgi:hypothetical protein